MISLIVAASDNNVIGKDNKLIWRQSDDLKRFKELTSGKPVIMGRKTYESIGRPLPNRLNIVVTRNKDLSIDGCIVVHSIEEGFRKARGRGSKEIFVIGGAEIYRKAFKYVSNIYLTRVHEEFDGDSFFYPEKIILNDGFELKEKEWHEADEKNEYNYSYLKYER